MYSDIYNNVKIPRNGEDLQSIMSNLQPNCCLKVDFQKVDRHTGGNFKTPNAARTISCKAWNSPAEYPSWVSRCEIKGSDGTILNPKFWQKVQGQKHLRRWEIAEHQIPSVKMLFETNTNGHKHPNISQLMTSTLLAWPISQMSTSLCHKALNVSVNYGPIDIKPCKRFQRKVQWCWGSVLFT